MEKDTEKKEFYEKWEEENKFKEGIKGIVITDHRYKDREIKTEKRDRQSKRGRYKLKRVTERENGKDGERKKERERERDCPP